MHVLTFSETQVESFGSDLLDRYISETIQHLRQRFPAECEERSDDDLSALVEKARLDGANWKVTSGYDVRRLSECYLIYGDDFAQTDETTWARHILRRDDLTGRDKMTAIAQTEAFNLGGSA